MADASINTKNLERKPDDDYTVAVCWLFRKRGDTHYGTIEALVDAEDFLQVRHLHWGVQYIGKNRLPRIVCAINRRSVYLARLLLSEPAGLMVDHRNRNSLDDRRQNIRVATIAQNNCNKPQIARARSKYKGVAFHTSTGRWQVYSGPRTNKVMVGHFNCEIEAARAYDAFAKEAYGEFAYLNFPGE